MTKRAETGKARKLKGAGQKSAAVTRPSTRISKGHKRQPKGSAKGLEKSQHRSE